MWSDNWFKSCDSLKTEHMWNVAGYGDPRQTVFNMLHWGWTFNKIQLVLRFHFYKTNETKRNEIKQNETKPIEVKRNEIKRNETKRRYISLRFVSIGFVSFRPVSFRFVWFRSVSFRFVSLLFRFALYRYPISYHINIILLYRRENMWFFLI